MGKLGSSWRRRPWPERIVFLAFVGIMCCLVAGVVSAGLHPIFCLAVLFGCVAMGVIAWEVTDG
jgi:hypothetical protein